MSEMLELAERVEALTGPDREVDRAIAVALSLPWDYAADWGPRGHDRPTASPYTASLDAAMTLVGPMQLSKAGELWDGTIKCGWATVHNYSNTERGMMWDDQHDVCAKTPALALCAAALRARHHLENSDAE